MRPGLNLLGIPVVESRALPLKPSPGEVARRMVRHGLADVLAWLGEEVGPEPHAETHFIVTGGTVLASAAIIRKGFRE